jgi:hypothetical protein
MLLVGFIVVGEQTKTLSISFEFSTWLCGPPDAERIWHVCHRASTKQLQQLKKINSSDNDSSKS